MMKQWTEDTEVRKENEELPGDAEGKNWHQYLFYIGISTVETNFCYILHFKKGLFHVFMWTNNEVTHCLLWALYS